MSMEKEDFLYKDKFICYFDAGKLSPPASAHRTGGTVRFRSCPPFRLFTETAEHAGNGAPSFHGP